MSLNTYNPSQWQRDLDEVVVTFFAAMIGSEISLRIFAMHPVRYFSSSWECLDVVVLLATYMLYALRKTPGVDLSVLRFVALHPFVFRGLRILKLLYGSKLSKSWVTLTEMRTVLVSLVESVNMYLSLIALLLILCFIFAVAGIQLFGNLCTQSDLTVTGRAALRCKLTDPSMVLNDQANFKNLPCSLMVLMRMVLLDGWSELLRAFSRPAGKQVRDELFDWAVSQSAGGGREEERNERRLRPVLGSIRVFAIVARVTST